jgi:hypothetical protein
MWRALMATSVALSVGGSVSDRPMALVGDPCALLTAADVSKAFGIPADRRSSVTKKDSNFMDACSYEIRSDSLKRPLVVVAVFASKDLTTLSGRVWTEQFFGRAGWKYQNTVVNGGPCSIGTGSGVSSTVACQRDHGSQRIVVSYEGKSAVAHASAVASLLATAAARL